MRPNFVLSAARPAPCTRLTRAATASVKGSMHPTVVPRPSTEEMLAAMKRADEATERVWGDDPNTPTTYASLGENKPREKGPEVPMARLAAPALLGVGAALVFVLNTGGFFGEGPDIDALTASVEALGKV